LANFRIDRISEEVRREIDRILREDIHDPRITGTYCITRADVTRDLKFAKIYISILEEDLAAEMMKALKSASGFIRRELGRKAQLRNTPEVIFVRDENIAYGAHIARILKDVSENSEGSVGGNDKDERNL
jgi:ribosome-binding factor A